MSLRDSLVKLVQNNDDFSPFYNNTSDLIYKNNKLKEENAAHEKTLASLKLKYNQGQITKEQFDSDMQALLNSKTNVVDTTKLNVKTPTDIFNPLAREHRTAQNREDKLHKEKLEAIENTDSDAAIEAAKTKYDKTKTELQEKLNNGTITQEQYDEQQARALKKKIARNQFTLNDFQDQLRQVQKMGNMKDLAGMLPGMDKALKDVDIPDNAFKSTEAILQSMTPYEKENPDCINGSRRQRIAKGSGTSIAEVNKLLKQFEQTKKMMKMAVDGSLMQKLKGFRH